MADRTMKITEGDNKTSVEGKGVDINREGKEWFIDTEAGRIYLDQLLDPYDGVRVNLRLSVEIVKPEDEGD